MRRLLAKHGAEISDGTVVVIRGDRFASRDPDPSSNPARMGRAITGGNILRVVREAVG